MGRGVGGGGFEDAPERSRGSQTRCYPRSAAQVFLLGRVMKTFTLKSKTLNVLTALSRWFGSCALILIPSRVNQGEKLLDVL